jgi:putative PIN family toxin of toxin-antitoxin system
VLKVVLDTNVIVSGFNYPKSNPGNILASLASGEIVNFISIHIIAETKRILADKFLWTNAQVDSAEFWLLTFSRPVKPKICLTVINHAPDNRILECAVQAQADYIVSGDRHLLNLNHYQHIEIMTPAAFLEIFNQ